MIGKAKFKIDYTWNRKELFETAKKELLSEGWKIAGQTLPAILEHVKPTDIFSCWFEREWNVEFKNYDNDYDSYGNN